MSKTFKIARNNIEIQVSPSLGYFLKSIPKQFRPYVLFLISFGISNAKLCYSALLWKFILIIRTKSNTFQFQFEYNDIDHCKMATVKLVPFIHQTCRNTIYPKSNVKRFNVPDHLVKWTNKFADYLPVFYESPNIIDASWADPMIGNICNIM